MIVVDAGRPRLFAILEDSQIARSVGLSLLTPGEIALRPRHVVHHNHSATPFSPPP
ncbi:hypothetical protein KIN20_008824 [Parelaphostrongylus tenuis]|uniref:Uncharacterized protein n=1 Tax=Parelaphostrongylus tenuis TaxID=148309 RepID=A0AAD5QMX5_PARTN|nr:hypothetical protein KIN20_008824 [Parelaphostrongylus tenuis]